MGLKNKKSELLNYIFKLDLIFLQKINILYFINLFPSYLKNYKIQIILFINKLKKTIKLAKLPNGIFVDKSISYQQITNKNKKRQEIKTSCLFDIVVLRAYSATDTSTGVSSL
jgi:hypothetical protein